MTTTGIIFDVDGTLWDSTDTVAKAWTDAIQQNTHLNLEINGAVLKTLFGKTMSEIASALFPSLPEKDRLSILDICYEYENRLLKTQPGRLYDKVYETLSILSKKYPLFIVSNCQCGYIELLLETTKITPFITDTLCFGQTQAPKSQTILNLMERNHLKNAVYIGDTQGDYDACKAAGIPFIYADYGFGEIKNAPVSIHTFSELVTLLPDFF